MTRRRFNGAERAALYLAAGGKCSLCSVALAPGWHADHMHPHSKGGATDVVNGQALCAACNLHKGSRISMTDKPLRAWQAEALDRYLKHNATNFLAASCPAAGKTTWALTVAKSLIDRGVVHRVIVVVPTDALREQWSDHTGTGVHLRPYELRSQVDKRGYDGVVTTYQALGGQVGLDLRAAIGRGSDTLVILDEIHHAAEDSAYGKALLTAFEYAGRRLLLTGTPWRTNAAERMPFVSFDDDDMLVCDYTYDYGQAVADGVCRRMDFPSVAGTAKWSRAGEKHEAVVTVNRTLKGSDKSDALRTLLDPSATGHWLSEVIGRAHNDLVSMRREHPDAAGLIVARDKHHARKVASALRALTGIAAPVIVSGEDGGANAEQVRRQIDRFKDSTDPWVIAVRMIAEGVDIPRLAVGVYATNVTTAMFFNQVVGRFVRRRDDEHLTARLYVPPTRELWAHVEEIQRLLPQRLEESRQQLAVREAYSASPPVSDFVSLGSTADGLTLVRTHDGDIAGSLVSDWSAWLTQAGIPPHYATQAAGQGVTPPVRVAPVAEPPKHRRDAALRDELTDTMKKVGWHCYSGDYMRAYVNLMDRLGRRSNTKVKDLDTEELERAIGVAEDALASRDVIA